MGSYLMSLFEFSGRHKQSSIYLKTETQKGKKIYAHCTWWTPTIILGYLQEHE